MNPPDHPCALAKCVVISALTPYMCCFVLHHAQSALALFVTQIVSNHFSAKWREDVSRSHYRRLWCDRLLQSGSNSQTFS